VRICVELQGTSHRILTHDITVDYKIIISITIFVRSVRSKVKFSERERQKRQPSTSKVFVEAAGVENFSLNLHNFLCSTNAVRIVITDFMLSWWFSVYGESVSRLLWYIENFYPHGCFEDKYYFQLHDQSKQCYHAVTLFRSVFREIREGGWGRFSKKGPSEKELLVEQDLLDIRPLRVNTIPEEKASALQ